MRKGIFADIFPAPTLAENLNTIRALGFDGVHFKMTVAGLPALPQEMPQGLPERIREEFRRADLTMYSLSATYNIIDPDRSRAVAGSRALQVLARSARQMGTDVLTLCTGTRHPTDKWTTHPENRDPGVWADTRDTLTALGTAARRYRLRALAIEPEPGNVIAKAADATRMLRELDQYDFEFMGTQHWRFILDPANLFETGDAELVRRRIDAFVEQLGDRIEMVHVKDRTAEGQITVPGHGIVDFEHLKKRLDAARIEVPWVAHGFSAEVAGEVVGLMRYLEGA